MEEGGLRKNDSCDLVRVSFDRNVNWHGFLFRASNFFSSKPAHALRSRIWTGASPETLCIVVTSSYLQNLPIIEAITPSINNLRPLLRKTAIHNLSLVTLHRNINKYIRARYNFRRLERVISSVFYP